MCGCEVCGMCVGVRCVGCEVCGMCGCGKQETKTDHTQC